MKKGYIKLLSFEILFITLLLLNSFVLSILNNYGKLLSLVIMLVLFAFFFGFEKDRNRYAKTICLEVCIYLLIFFLLYYLSGIFFEFYRNNLNNFSWKMLRTTLFPLIATIILKEYLRYMMLKKSEGSKTCIITTCIFFIVFDLTLLITPHNYNSFYDVFVFIATRVLPIISANVLCSYIAMHDGYKPTIIYTLVMELYIYILPIIPNPNPYIYSLIHFLAPFTLLWRLYLFYKKDRDEKIERAKQKKEFLGLIPCIVIIGLLVYFTSGYFTYHAIVIGSGSMVPLIRKGDVVVVEKNHADIDKLMVGDVVAVKKDDIIIVHRIAKKIQVDGEYYLYTKGDANNAIDGYKVSSDMIYGMVNVKIPYIGLLPVWLRDL